MTEKQTGFNAPGQYDTVSKRLIQDHAEDWAAFTLGTSDVEVLDIVDTEQPTIQTHRADSFIRVKIAGEEAIVHIEMQTRDSYAPRMPSRMAGYIGRAIERFDLPIYSHVIYLAPGAGGRDPGEYIQHISGYPIHIGYKVIRLSELEGELFLESGAKGLLPFTPLMRPPAGTDGEAWLRSCVEAVDSATRDMSDRSDFFTGLGIFSDLVYDQDLILIAMEGINVEESRFVQYFVEKNERASVIEGILEYLEFRFEGSDLETVESQLAGIEDIDRLKQLRRAAFQTPSVAAFQQTFATNGSSDD